MLTQQTLLSWSYLTDHHTGSAECAALRTELQVWKSKFKDEHGRSPTVEDITKAGPEIGML